MIWYESNNPNGFVTGKKFSVDEPCVTVMAAGMGGDSLGHWHLCSSDRDLIGPPPMVLRLRHDSAINQRQNGMDLDSEPCPTVMTGGLSAFGDYWIEEDGKAMSKQQIANSKPPYRVPLMSEIVALPSNGLKVASTFSGAGGSCTGYRMAGYQVVWANEFVPAAQASYKANADTGCHLDCRDIKLVQPEEILEIIGLQKGELDLFDGSPPCQAFSTAGKREKGWGKAKKYEHGASQCNETLFGEYIRLLRGLMPKVFVAENVSGLIKGTAKGYFLEILKELKASGYRVACKVLDAQWLGVPQTRQRTIFVGVRNDLGLEPVHPKPLIYRYSVRDALPWGEVKPGSKWNPHNKTFDIETEPCGTIPATPDANFQVEVETDISKYAIGQEWDNLKSGEKSDKYFSLQKVDSESPSPCIQASHGQGSIAGVVHPTEKRKFTIAEVKRICAFPDDFILCGSYAQQWERLGNSVPPVMMAHIATAIRDGIFAKLTN